MSVTAQGGYVAAQNPSGGGWSALAGTASTSTIQTGNNTQFKFSGPSSAPTGTTFNPIVSSNGSSTTTVTGGSSVTSPTVPGGTTAYAAQWTSSTQSNATGPITAGSGTYDPWNVTYGDLHQAGKYSDFGHASFYYQSALIDGKFDLLAKQTASYNFDLSLTDINGQLLKFVDLTVHSDGNLDLGFAAHADAGFKIYLLDEYASFKITARTQSIDTRLSHGTLLSDANGAFNIRTYLDKYLLADGSLDAPLSFGIVYDDPNPLPQYSTLSNPNQTIVGYHSNTPVPEPSSIAALAIGGLALLRRRKR